MAGLWEKPVMIFKKVAPLSYKPISKSAWLLCFLHIFGILAVFYMWATHPALKKTSASATVLAVVFAWNGLYLFIASKNTDDRSI